jgi:hypothetical protein
MATTLLWRRRCGDNATAASRLLWQRRDVAAVAPLL